MVAPTTGCHHISASPVSRCWSWSHFLKSFCPTPPSLQPPLHHFRITCSTCSPHAFPLTRPDTFHLYPRTAAAYRTFIHPAVAFGGVLSALSHPAVARSCRVLVVMVKAAMSQFCRCAHKSEVIFNAKCTHLFFVACAYCAVGH